MSKQIPVSTQIPMPKKPVSPMKKVILDTLNGIIDEIKYVTDDEDDFIEVTIKDHSEGDNHFLSREEIRILHAALVEYVDAMEGTPNV